MRKRRYFAALIAAGIFLFSFSAYAEENASDSQTEDNSASQEGAVLVEYDNLRELLMEGCQDLKDRTEDYYTNIKNYKNLIATLTDERDYMKLMKTKYEDDDAAASAQYSSNAANLSNSLTRLERQLELATNQSGFLSTDKTIDSYTMSAQALMNSYNQMVLNVSAKEKSAEAAEVNYRTVIEKYAAGLATQAEVDSASNSLLMQHNQLASYQQQAEDLRFDLLSMLGLADKDPVIIGTLPEFDPGVIDAIDFESDCEKAIGNSSSVQNVRHGKASTAAEISLKSSNEAEAEGTVLAGITDSYQQLLALKAEYLAAEEAYAAAEADYQLLQLKKQAGMLNTADYLTGEASYLESSARMETAKMNLYQAYENYCWEVKGVG